MLNAGVKKMSNIDSDRADYAKQLWTLTSAIAAFCILQALAFAYNFKDCDFRQQAFNAGQLIPTCFALATIVYAGSVASLEHSQWKLVAQAKAIQDVVQRVAIFKVVAILLSCAGALTLDEYVLANGSANMCPPSATSTHPNR